MPPTEFPAPRDVTESDLAALQGDWRQTRLEADGIVDPPDTHGAPDAITTFHQRRFVVHRPDGSVLLQGSFSLDASTTPKSITWVDAMGADQGKALPASYTLEGDRFEFIAADAGAPRPTEFRTVPGLTMRSFVRCR